MKMPLVTTRWAPTIVHVSTDTVELGSTAQVRDQPFHGPIRQFTLDKFVYIFGWNLHVFWG